MRKLLYKILAFIAVILMALIPISIAIYIILDNLMFSLMLFCLVACIFILAFVFIGMAFYVLPATIALFATLWQFATKPSIDFKKTFKEKYRSYCDLTF